MNKRDEKAVSSVFGAIRKTEMIRTQILLAHPYGDITVPDVKLREGQYLMVARAPDDKFFEGAYWANYGPKPSDDDPDAFVVPVLVKSYMAGWFNNWQHVTYGDFVTTASGVIVLDVQDSFAWEGYQRPGKRDYNYDRRRLAMSAAALKSLAAKQGTPRER